MSDSFWRTEVWHPLTVHFPIALLIFSTLVFFVSLFFQESRKIQWQRFSTVALIVGTVGAWLALYTGDLADGVVARKICDPLILKDHEIAAQTSTYLFTAASFLSIIIFYSEFLNTFKKILVSILTVLMVGGCIYLALASHAGATLVYEQGAGVRDHEVDCK
ncbi:MAG TPA: DUF2231 domain-containing protein [Chryseosolibacter sp.]|nr:DUF2231 domain-containing protein [Chryseosolibacter sp.]